MTQTFRWRKRSERFDTLVRRGSVRWIAASNITAPRLREALSVSRHEGFAPYVALQSKYNLMDRASFEDSLAGVCA